MNKRLVFLLLSACGFVLTACAPQNTPEYPSGISIEFNEVTDNLLIPTPLPTRPIYTPGELVDYIAQTGDSLPALAAHFNTSVQEILDANPIIPSDATTLPPGLPMEIPIYHRNFWGSSYQIIPDSQFINGPAAVSFDTGAFVTKSNGWLKTYVEYAAGENRNGAEIIDYISTNYSISPRVLLATAEYLAGALSSPTLPQSALSYPLGLRHYRYRGFYRQLLWAANRLNNGYYGWRSGDLIDFNLPDNTLERPDPWQNAATIGLHYFFSALLSIENYHHAVSPIGYAQTFKELFGDPWENEEPHIPGSLEQPGLILPFQPGMVWAFTGGPHTGWGVGAPLAALDFAPASDITGCYISNEWVTAVTSGTIVRSEGGFIVLDLDADGDERTGWTIFYLHTGSRDLIPLGSTVNAGEPIGHPSCEGGSSTGTHVHVARRFNGEWIIADSILPFVMEGWIPTEGKVPYEGTLSRFEQTVTACECASQETNILATGSPDGVLPQDQEPVP